MSTEVQKLREAEFKNMMKILKASWNAGDMNSVAMAASQIAFMAERPDDWLRQQQGN